MRLVFLTTGILLHTLWPYNPIIGTIGFILIIITPYKLFEAFEDRIYADPELSAGTWKNFPNDKLDELLSYIEPKISVSRGGSKTLSMGYVPSAVIVSLIGIGIGAFCQDADICPWVGPLDALVLIFVLVQFGGGSPTPHPLAIQVTALTCFRNFVLPSGFHKKFEAQIVPDENGDPDILNARLQISPDKPIDNFLCMMATINRTNVQGTIFPYAYFVVVFRGTTIANETTVFSEEMNRLNEMSQFRQFRFDVKVQDGNSVIVVLPASIRQYTTDLIYIQTMCDFMAETCQLLNQYRHVIETLDN